MDSSLKREEWEECQRLVLEPRIVSFASALMVWVVSGTLPSGSQSGTHEVQVEDFIKEAMRLKAAGAIRLLREQYGWQCSLIEHIEEVIKCLNDHRQASQ